MGAPTPQTLLEAIANSAADGSSPGDKTFPLPDAPTGTNAASIQGGFPAITMESEQAGGEPPLGQDMNGYLFLITSHTLWVECGQLYTFNDALATAIGGYLQGTILGMADGTGTWLCVAGPNSNNPDTGGSGWVPIASYGFATVPITGGVVALSTDQAKRGVVVLTGILASNATIQVPQNVQEWLFINNTSNAGSGTFVTTIVTAASGSAGVVVPQGGFTSPTSVYSVGDGNVYPTVAPLAVPIAQAPTPLTLVERTNAGYVLAVYFNMSAGVSNGVIVNVCAEYGDGYIRLNGLSNFESQLLLQGLGGLLVNGQVPYSVVAQWATTFFNSATLTGDPTAPTAAAGTSNTQIATTAFANPLPITNGNGTCLTLPSGYKLQFGSANPNGGAVTVTYPVPFTVAGFPMAINISGGATQAWLPSAPGLANFRLANSGGSSLWFAIGL